MSAQHEKHRRVKGQVEVNTEAKVEVEKRGSGNYIEEDEARMVPIRIRR